MNYENREALQAFIECNKKLGSKKFQIIKGQYSLQSKEEYDELKNAILPLKEEYTSFENANPNVHAFLGKNDNKLFMNSMISIFETLEATYANQWETVDFNKIKNAIRTITVYLEFERRLNVLQHSSRIKDVEDAPLHLDANGNMVPVSDQVKNQFSYIVEQQKKLLSKYEEAHEFIFGTRTDENENMKTI